LVFDCLRGSLNLTESGDDKLLISDLSGNDSRSLIKLSQLRLQMGKDDCLDTYILKAYCCWCFCDLRKGVAAILLFSAANSLYFFITYDQTFAASQGAANYGLFVSIFNELVCIYGLQAWYNMYINQIRFTVFAKILCKKLPLFLILRFLV
jgi:hypothetical protein